MSYGFFEISNKSITNQIEHEVFKRLSPRRGWLLPDLINDIAMECDVDSRTVRRKVNSLIDKGIAYVANPDEKPFMIFKVEFNEPKSDTDLSNMSLEEAIFILRTREYGRRMMSAASFQKLSDSGFFNTAQNIVLNTKETKHKQKELNLEGFSSKDALAHLYHNTNIGSGVIEVIKDAIYEDLELEFHLKGYHEPVFVKPEKIRTLDQQPLLKVKQLNYPHSLTHVNIEDISDAYIVEYCAFRSPDKMRIAA